MRIFTMPTWGLFVGSGRPPVAQPSIMLAVVMPLQYCMSAGEVPGAMRFRMAGARATTKSC